MFGAGSFMFFSKSNKRGKNEKNPGGHGQACSDTVLNFTTQCTTPLEQSFTYVLCI
jgi:hypothetical protein